MRIYTALLGKALKRTTNLVGMKVARDPHYKLTVLYAKIMRALALLPETAAYRKYTEALVCERANVLKKTDDWEMIERNIDCGQVEELIIQAENELQLARRMLVWKPWEQLMREEPANQWEWPPKNQNYKKM